MCVLNSLMWGKIGNILTVKTLLREHRQSVVLIINPRWGKNRQHP